MKRRKNYRLKFSVYQHNGEDILVGMYDTLEEANEVQSLGENRYIKVKRGPFNNVLHVETI